MAGAAFLTVFPSVAFAQTDYVSHMEQFELAAKVLNAGTSCGRFGYIVDKERALAFGSDAVTSAVEDGMLPSLANQMAITAIEEETARQEYLVQQVKDAQKKDSATAKAAVDRFLAYWQNHCASIAANPKVSEFFRQPSE
jgi:hypothetical protein